MARTKPARTKPALPEATVYVCHASSCLRSGSEGVLTEIEELVTAVGANCPVRRSGCLGYCSEAPNAVVARGRSDEEVHVRLRSLERSADVVAAATGAQPDLEAAGVRGRVAGLRAARARQRAADEGKWNAALNGLAEAAVADVNLRRDLAAYVAAAGVATNEAPRGYTRWTLESREAVTPHSALFTLRSADLKRGTPHPRGRGKRPEPNTWHSTLLAEVGANAEGPLPWVERDYTPISSAHDWEQGRCSLLVKVYADGLASTWLNRMPAEVWLSKPRRTLGVPALTAPTDGPGFRPASVLLVLAGTGVVALPQVLAHRDPFEKLRIATPQRDRLPVPIDVVYGCRADDGLLIAELAAWCAEDGDEAGVRAADVCVTPPGGGAAIFDAAVAPDVAAAVAGRDNVTVHKNRRVDEAVLAAAYARAARPCRVVVSGPAAFNAVARALLADLVDDDGHITVLAA